MPGRSHASVILTSGSFTTSPVSKLKSFQGQKQVHNRVMIGASTTKYDNTGFCDVIMLGDVSDIVYDDDGVGRDSPKIRAPREPPRKRVLACKFCNRTHSRDFRPKHPLRRSNEVLQLLEQNNFRVINHYADETCLKCHIKCSNVLKKLRHVATSSSATKSEYRLKSIVFGNQRQSRSGLAQQLERASPGKHNRDGSMILCTAEVFVAAAEKLSKCAKCGEELQNAAPLKIRGVKVVVC